MDCKYHRHYIRERQMLQDAIIGETLDKAKVVDANSGEMRTTPTEPFLVFIPPEPWARVSLTLSKRYSPYFHCRRL